ncbi:hypothetical protein [Paenibacillus sp. FSL H8-0537]|uniref:hypothetical protein n=1 Tax=Paenibacillus sp. FSL H8-0537 TaxID=2921399 RepID=UPI003101507D
MTMLLGCFYLCLWKLPLDLFIHESNDSMLSRSYTRFFKPIDGAAYQALVYDNMKGAVKRFVGDEKESTEGLLQLSVYYGFEFRFCNARSGNEKEHVERTVEVARRKAFAFRDTFETLEEDNDFLLEVCEKLNNQPQDRREGKTATACLEEEQPYLFQSLPMFDTARVVHARVDIYATLVGCREWRLNLLHDLETLKKKPGALTDSTALAQAQSYIKNIYKTYIPK